jgi:hypothetical protein
MAKVKNNVITEGLSGKLNKRLVFRQMRDGSTVLCTVPDFSNRVFSEGQLTHQTRFKKASAYAKASAKTRPLYAELAARLHKPAYNIALSDWFHGPVIHNIKRQAGRISIDVTDNVKVASVRVTILDEQGNAQANGQAVWVKDDRWEYETIAEGHLLVEAFDLPGNVTRHEA